MGNRISTAQEPVIMTAALLEAKVIQNMSSHQELDVAELLRLIKMDGLEYSSVNTLNLEHESLINVDELWKFKHLTKLELPNNYLEKIEGVDCLVNLQILDLSFNFIKCMCNLENLVNLIYLNLTSNEIVLLENMHALKKLETFLIRHNRIKTFDNVYYLKQFSNLTSLAIGKNPLMQEKDASLHIIVTLTQLKYLDFSVISPEQIEMAYMKFPHEDQNSSELNLKGKFQCCSSHSDKEAYVEGLANGQGFQSIFLSDKNYQLLHSFPLAAEISQDHNLKSTKIFDKWHEVGHNYYQLIQNEKSQFLLMISKAKEFSLEVSRNEEAKFIDFKENISKRLCYIYQHAGSDDERDKKVFDFKKTCEFYLQKTFRNFMNSSCLCIDIISNICKKYESEVLPLNAKYVQDVEKFVTDLMAINKIFSERLQDFYLNIQSTGFHPLEESSEEKATINDPTFMQIIKKKELIEMTIALSVRITSTMLKERSNNLKLSLHNDLMENITQVSEEAFITQSEFTRNTVVFCNKQKYFIDKLFSKNNIFKQYLGYS